MKIELLVVNFKRWYQCLFAIINMYLVIGVLCITPLSRINILSPIVRELLKISRIYDTGENLK